MNESIINWLINKAAEKYRIERLFIDSVEEFPDHFIVTLSGGLNGYGRFSNYLEDVKHIIDQFDQVCLIEWKNDCLDDIWTLKILIK